MVKQAIVNSSPIIFLSKAGLMDLLKLAGDEVFVPDAVVQEINQRGASDVSVRAIAAAEWLQVVDVPTPDPLIQAWDLGKGETAVLTHALHHAGMFAVIDDGLGRKCAETFEIPLYGTLGLVLKAKRLGMIAEARPVLHQLRKYGMYLKDATLEQALALIGE